jgi:diguanylate cyclase (GGDEF)-like protein
LAYFGLSETDIEFTGRAVKLPSKSEKPLKINLDRNKTFPINYMVDMQRIKNIPFWEIFKKNPPKDLFKDKIVIIGNTSELHHDNHPTPLGITPGSIIITNDVLALITGNFIKFLPLWLNYLILIFICVLISYMTYRLSLFFVSSFSLFLITLIFIASVTISVKNYSTDFFAPVFMTFLTLFIANGYKYIGLAVEISHLKTMAITDELTGLYIYRYFKLTLPMEFYKAVNGNRKLSLVIIDIDHFKILNDTYGHNQGNTILEDIGKILKASSRQENILCRYGGDEFIIILKSTTQNDAALYADRIRKIVQDYNFSNTINPAKATVSCGVCGLKESEAKTSEQLLEFADAALYRAKENGRNQTHIYGKDDKP